MSTDIKEMIDEVLGRGYLMSLATSDNGGLWVADVVYIHDGDLNIYWRSDTDVRHSQAIEKNPQVAGSITTNTKAGERNSAIQFSGSAKKIDGFRQDLAKKLCIKANKPLSEEGGDILKGKESWYILKPDMIDVPYATRLKYKLKLNR